LIAGNFLRYLYFRCDRETYVKQISCSSASPSYVFEDYLSSEVDHVLDRVVEDLIDEAAAAVVTLENV
jgi:hypothetical protein